MPCIVSKSNNMGLVLKDIAKDGDGWRSGSMFAKFYGLPIQEKNFGQKLLLNKV